MCPPLADFGWQIFLRTETKVESAEFADSVFTGFIYPTSASFKDVTDLVLPECKKLLDEIVLPNKVIKTTMRKLCVGVFDFDGDGKRKLAVINVHFKKQALTKKLYYFTVVLDYCSLITHTHTHLLLNTELNRRAWPSSVLCS